jgi:hypothetical protein
MVHRKPGGGSVARPHLFGVPRSDATRHGPPRVALQSAPELPISSVGTASVVRVLRDPALQPVEHPPTMLGPALRVD